jgi:hypothetical protein
MRGYLASPFYAAILALGCCLVGNPTTERQAALKQMLSRQIQRLALHKTINWSGEIYHAKGKDHLPSALSLLLSYYVRRNCREAWEIIIDLFERHEDISNIFFPATISANDLSFGNAIETPLLDFLNDQDKLHLQLLVSLGWVRWLFWNKKNEKIIGSYIDSKVIPLAEQALARNDIKGIILLAKHFDLYLVDKKQAEIWLRKIQDKFPEHDRACYLLGKLI